MAAYFHRQLSTADAIAPTKNMSIARGRSRIRSAGRRVPRLLSLFLFLLLNTIAAAAASGGPSQPPPPPPPPPPRSTNAGNGSSSSTSTSNTPGESDALRVVETEIWSPATSSWIGATTSNTQKSSSSSLERWTNYATGRPCVSPAELAPPRLATFDGDWKIVLGDGRDPYGWDYTGIATVDQQEPQQPNRRQRIWLRAIKYEESHQEIRPETPQSYSDSSGTKQRKQRSATDTSVSPSTKIKVSSHVSDKRRRRPTQYRPRSLAWLPTYLPKLELPTTRQQTSKLLQLPHQKFQRVQSMAQNAWQTVQDDFNFKGFGFSFYKSFIFKSSIGAALRLPLTINWDSFERHPEWPSLSSSAFVFYSAPFHPTIACSLSASVNVEWVKHMAFQIAIVVRHIIAVALLVLARGFLLAASALAFPVTRQLLHQNSQTGDDYWLGWDSLPSLKQSLREQPQFSGSLQERVGISYSWRISRSRGYEFRRSVWHLYLPTLLSLLQHADRVYAACQRLWWEYYVSTNHGRLINRYLFKSKNTKKSKNIKEIKDDEDTTSQDTDDNGKNKKLISLVEQAQESKWADWIVQRKTGSLGISTGYPIPDKPHFSCSAVLSLSGFYFLQDLLLNKQRQLRSGVAGSKPSDFKMDQQQNQVSPATRTAPIPQHTAAGTAEDRDTSDDRSRLVDVSGDVPPKKSIQMPKAI